MNQKISQFLPCAELNFFLSIILLSYVAFYKWLERGLSSADHRSYAGTKSPQNNSICATNYSSYMFFPSIHSRVKKKTLWLIVTTNFYIYMCMYIPRVYFPRNVKTKSFYVPLPVMETMYFLFFFLETSWRKPRGRLNKDILLCIGNIMILPTHSDSE